jgi:hypothetical protein
VYRFSRLLPALAAVAALAGSAFAAPTVGSKAPELTAKELTGKTFHLSQFRGKSPVLVNFFSIT